MQRIVFDFGGKMKISPPLSTGNRINVNPGDLTKFAPYGNGVYGYDGKPEVNPLKSAPPQEPTGGTVFFGSDVNKDDFQALLRLLQVKIDIKDYAIFIACSEQPVKDGYIVQVRLISKFGLKYMYGSINTAEYENFEEQKLNLSDLLWLFIEDQKKKWGTSFTEDKEKGLAGMFGGDGDYEREELAFGFTMENEYYGIYRIWSRAWLVTK